MVSYKNLLIKINKNKKLENGTKKKKIVFFERREERIYHKRDFIEVMKNSFANIFLIYLKKLSLRNPIRIVRASLTIKPLIKFLMLFLVINVT